MDNNQPLQSEGSDTVISQVNTWVTDRLFYRDNVANIYPFYQQTPSPTAEK